MKPNATAAPAGVEEIAREMCERADATFGAAHATDLRYLAARLRALPAAEADEDLADAALRRRLEAYNAKLRDVLARKGYRESCDIPACNCGDEWAHGGYAETRLREIGDLLGLRTQGVTLADAVKRLVEQDDALRAAARPDARRRLA